MCKVRTASSNSSSRFVALAHYSVKEYLVSERSFRSRASRYSIQDIACNEFIARSCIGYLLQFQEPDFLSDESIQESKLALYAAKFWIKHTQAVSQNTEALNRVIMELFSTGHGAYLNWARIYDPDQPWHQANVKKHLSEVPAPLYYASLSSLIEIVELLLSKGADVNAKGGFYSNALQAALWRR